MNARAGGQGRGEPWFRELLRAWRGAAERERRRARPRARAGGRGPDGAVPVLADGAVRRGAPAGREGPAEAGGGDDEGGGDAGIADPVGLHLPGPVHRPRSDRRQDDGHVRRGRVAGGDAAGPLPRPRPRLAVRRRPVRPGVGRVLQRRPAAQRGHDRQPGQGRLRPTPRRQGHRGRAAEGEHPRAAQRREPGRRPDARHVHPVPQPRLRHAAEVDAAGAALQPRPAQGDEALPVDDPHRLPAPDLPEVGRRGRVQERPQGVRGRGDADRHADDADRVLRGRLPARPQHGQGRLQLERELPRRRGHARPAVPLHRHERQPGRPEPAVRHLDRRLPPALQLRRGRPPGPGRARVGVQPGAAHRHEARDRHCTTCRRDRSGARRLRRPASTATSPTAT